MFSAGPEGFEGGMTAAKYMRIVGTSKATATRDLAELAASGALAREQSGRNTRYRLTGV
jgi:Fic family protein